MPKITFAKGDVFRYENITSGYGIVMGNGEAVIVAGRGGREGYRVFRGGIPESAQPFDLTRVPSEVQMALRGARAADR